MLSFPQNLTVESKVKLELSHPRCVRTRKAKAHVPFVTFVLTQFKRLIHHCNSAESEVLGVCYHQSD